MSEADHMQKISEQHLEELRSKHREVKLVVYNGNELVFRRPLRAEIKQHRAKSHSEDKAERADADEQLAQQTIVHVNGAEGNDARGAFLALLEEWPYMASNRDVARAMSLLSGALQEDAVKTSGTSSETSASPPKALRKV